MCVCVRASVRVSVCVSVCDSSQYWFALSVLARGSKAQHLLQCKKKKRKKEEEKKEKKATSSSATSSSLCSLFCICLVLSQILHHCEGDTIKQSLQ